MHWSDVPGEESAPRHRRRWPVSDHRWWPLAARHRSNAAGGRL